MQRRPTNHGAQPLRAGCEPQFGIAQENKSIVLRQQSRMSSPGLFSRGAIACKLATSATDFVRLARRS